MWLFEWGDIWWQLLLYICSRRTKVNYMGVRNLDHWYVCLDNWNMFIFKLPHSNLNITCNHVCVCIILNQKKWSTCGWLILVYYFDQLLVLCVYVIKTWCWNTFKKICQFMCNLEHKKCIKRSDNSFYTFIDRKNKFQICENATLKKIREKNYAFDIFTSFAFEFIWKMYERKEKYTHKKCK